jgi:hypothetical protein
LKINIYKAYEIVEFMMKHKYRGTKVWGGMAQPTDEIVEDREFTERVMAVVDDAWLKLSHGQQVVLQRIRAGYSLGQITRDYLSQNKGEDDLKRIEGVYQDAIDALRSHVAPFARANGIEIPGTA